MKYLNFLSLLLIATVLTNQTFAADGFDTWVGAWKGSCQLNPEFNGTKEFGASLTIKKNSKKDRFQWKLIYEGSGSLPRQVRNYEMVPVDKAKGHYYVDEKNGLLLDSFLDGKFLYSPFVINGNLIHATYILISDKQMILDMPMFDATPIRTTCLTGNANLCANSFGLKSSQRCTLSR